MQPLASPRQDFSRNMPDASLTPGKPWTLEEEEILRNYFSKKQTFSDIAKLLPGRTAQACQIHFKRYIDVWTGPWTKEDYESLAVLTKKHLRKDGWKDWSTIGSHLNRSPAECRRIYKKLGAGFIGHPPEVLQSRQPREGKRKYSKWTGEMDEGLIEMARKKMSFSQIGMNLSRDARGCSARLATLLKRNPYLLDENEGFEIEVIPDSPLPGVADNSNLDKLTADLKIPVVSSNPGLDIPFVETSASYSTDNSVESGFLTFDPYAYDIPKGLMSLQSMSDLFEKDDH